jgi:flagellar hook-length control protein FliK
MTASLNIISLAGNAGSGTPGAAASAVATGSSTGGGTQGFEDLFSVLLQLLTAKGAQTSANVPSNAANATGTTTDPGTTTVDLSSLVDLRALLSLKALIAGGTAENGQATDSSDVASATDPDSNPDTPDPLAAVLDLLIGALQSASTATPENDTLSFDAKSSDTLKALNALLASLTADKGSSTTAPQTAPLPPEVVDKLKTLNQLLSGQTADPELAELKTRITELLGTGSASEAAKKAASDSTTPSVASLLGQTSDKPAASTQRDVMVHVLDGAKIAIQPSPAQSGNGDTADQNPSQQQSAQTQPQARQTQAASGFVAQAIADGKDAGKVSDPASDPLTILTTQAADRLQQSPVRALPAAYTQQANRVDMPQIAFEIARHAVDGVNRFQIRLDPPEMGRIDVRLVLDKSGGMTAHLTVDRPETYDMLQRDVRVLERALAQTGLDANKTNLEFSLRQNPFSQQNSDQGQNQHKDVTGWLDEADDVPADPAGTTLPSAVLYRGIIRPGGVNLVA